MKNVSLFSKEKTSLRPLNVNSDGVGLSWVFNKIDSVMPSTCCPFVLGVKPLVGKLLRRRGCLID